MDKTLVSVIIPVFNASSYLEQTFSQLHNQTLSNFEVIFVDDCSTDNSVYMLKQFCERDSRFNFIEHSNNSGCGIARNSGIKIAKGEYIMCLDADDKFSKQLLEKTFNAITKANADVAIVKSIVKNIEDGTEKCFGQWRRIDEMIQGKKSIVIDNPTQVDNIVNLIDYVAWSKMVKTEYFKNNELWFYPLKYYEDIPFSFLTSFFADRIVFVNEPLITYFRKQKESMTSWTISKEYNMIYAFDKIICRQNEYDWRHIEIDFMSRVLTNIVAVYKAKDTNREDKEFILSLMREKYIDKWRVRENIDRYNLNDEVSSVIKSLL